MRIAFFHGLESKPFSEKNQILIEQYGESNVYAPAMDYRDPWLFDTQFIHLLHNIGYRNRQTFVYQSENIIMFTVKNI